MLATESNSAYCSRTVSVSVANQMLTLLHTKFILKMLNDRAKGVPQNT